MGYILRANVSKDTKQKAIWWYFNDWMKAVGNEYKHIGMKFANNENEGKQALNEEAEKYAKNYDESKDEAYIEDLTDKDNIKVTTVGDRIRIGPFKWKYNGKLTKANVKDQNGKTIDNVTFVKTKGGQYLTIGMEEIPSNGNKGFYIEIPANSGVTRITEIRTKVELDITASTMYFMRSDDGDWQNLIYIENEPDTDKTEINFPYDIPLTGKLRIKKVNEQNQSIALPNVGFRIYNVNLKQYVYQDASGNISYNNTGTEFKTNANGEITIDGLLLGDYLAYETTNPNYGYEFNSAGVTITVDSQDPSTADIITNKQVYVKLSGYVFLDVQSAKQSYRNNLYRNDTMDDEDQLLSNVQVRLVDRRTGNTVTNDSGAPFTATTKEINLGDSIIRYYQFVDVRIDDLSNYYMEFTYDGLTYQNVTPILTANNGSKSAEDATTRDNFNKSFSTIEGSGNGADTGVALNESGQKAHDLSYSYNGESYTSTLINNGLPTGQYPITANTDSAGYSIRGDFEYGDEEIPYINLGLYEREKPDLSLSKDMYNVRLSINGYNHIYEYAMKSDHDTGYSGEGFNVGVKWSSEYVSSSYKRAIYESDIDYTNENDKSKELQVYITYAIDVTNEASGIQTRVNSIADYYDKRYELVAVGRKDVSKEIGLEQIKPDEGTITENVSYTEQGQYNDKYSKVVINPDMTIDAGKTERIYVQFKLNREAVAGILNDEDLENSTVSLLDNIAEINSYSSFQNGSAYAGVDKDSNPGNITIEGEEVGKHDFDDTDISPALQLEIADARTLEGKVFLDSTSGELMTGQVRQGSGAYEDGETGIPNVEITFTENTGSGKVYTATTDENGDFHIDNYIPGDYTLTYTWGDETYTVQNYKGTIYQPSRDQSNKEWYKEDVDTRWTDAIDNYNQDQEAPKGSRQQIDAEMNTITNGTTFTRNKMDSTTPTMGVGVEYESTYTASVGDRYEYRIHNVDFGIVERARQDISLSKRVKTMKVTLANGRVLVDLEVKEDGSLEGTNSSVMYIPGSPSTEPKQGIVRLEMDSELMSGALLEVGYEFTATNNSELDYVGEKYYKYGEKDGPVVTITPTAIIDYLDRDWGFEANKNEGWEAIDLTDPRIDLAQPVRESTEMNNRQILYTENLATPIEPTKSNTTVLNVSKLLTSSQDIELDNETEIIKVEKTGGSDLTTTLGNYEPGAGPQVERDDDMAERVIITPNTGANLNFILPISIVISAFVIIGVGAIFIKKKVLNK